MTVYKIRDGEGTLHNVHAGEPGFAPSDTEEDAKASLKQAWPELDPDLFTVEGKE